MSKAAVLICNNVWRSVLSMLSKIIVWGMSEIQYLTFLNYFDLVLRTPV